MPQLDITLLFAVAFLVGWFFFLYLCFLRAAFPVLIFFGKLSGFFMRLYLRVLTHVFLQLRFFFSSLSFLITQYVSLFFLCACSLFPSVVAHVIIVPLFFILYIRE